jgi:hypothetical protein
MAARIPRRSFATPFVVTLVAAPACYTNTTSPPPSDPQGPIVNPPPPQRPAEQPQQPPTPPTANGPADGTRWTITKTASGCTAIMKVECPKPVDGHMVTCNPPPPRPYTCPEHISLDAPITIVANDGECRVDYGPMHCPPGAMCNPPPPRKVTCPQ